MRRIHRLLIHSQYKGQVIRSFSLPSVWTTCKTYCRIASVRRHAAQMTPLYHTEEDKCYSFISFLDWFRSSSSTWCLPTLSTVINRHFQLISTSPGNKVHTKFVTWREQKHSSNIIKADVNVLLGKKKHLWSAVRILLNKSGLCVKSNENKIWIKLIKFTCILFVLIQPPLPYELPYCKHQAMFIYSNTEWWHVLKRPHHQ